MHNVYTVFETYCFTCLRCGHEWESEYEVRRGQLTSGEEVVAYRLGGMPATAPAGRSCPACSGIRVRLRPRHTSRHETRSTGTAATPLDEPVEPAEPVSGG